MNQAEKLLRRMRQSLSGWGANDFSTLYTGFWFIAQEGSSHTIYVHGKHQDLRATVARHSALAKGYTSHAIKTIDELKRRQTEAAKVQENDDDEDTAPSE